MAGIEETVTDSCLLAEKLGIELRRVGVEGDDLLGWGASALRMDGAESVPSTMARTHSAPPTSLICISGCGRSPEQQHGLNTNSNCQPRCLLRKSIGSTTGDSAACPRPGACCIRMGTLGSQSRTQSPMLCDVHVKFLERLHTENTSSITPKLVENPFCRFLLSFGIDVVGVNQTLVSTKVLSSMPLVPASSNYAPQVEAIVQKSNRPGARRVRRPLHFPPGIRSGERGGR